MNNMFNNLAPRPEHLEAVQKTLSTGDYLTPQQISVQSGLTLTATKGAIAYLEKSGSLQIKRQNKSPRVVVKSNEV